MLKIIAAILIVLFVAVFVHGFNDLRKSSREGLPLRKWKFWLLLFVASFLALLNVFACLASDIGKAASNLILSAAEWVSDRVDIGVDP